MPQEILYGLEVVREAKEFLFLYSDLRVVLDLYDKFRRYQLTNLIPTKDFATHRKQISTYILHYERNNVNVTLNKIFNKLFGSNRDRMIMELFDVSIILISSFITIRHLCDFGLLNISTEKK